MEPQAAPLVQLEDRSKIQLVPMDSAEQFWLSTSLPATHANHKLMLLSIWESECDAAEGWIGREFLYSDYLIGPATTTDDETGEVVFFLRMLVIGPDHPPIAFGAKSAIDAIQKLAYAVGRNPPWDPPLRVRLRQARAKGPNRVYKFIPVWETS